MMSVVIVLVATAVAVCNGGVAGWPDFLDPAPLFMRKTSSTLSLLFCMRGIQNRGKAPQRLLIKDSLSCLDLFFVFFSTRVIIGFEKGKGGLDHPNTYHTHFEQGDSRI